MLFLEKHVVVWADINLLIFETKRKHHFLALVHVLRHFVKLQNDIADQFHEIIVAITGEEILELNGHQLGDESKQGHFCVFIQRLIRVVSPLSQLLYIQLWSLAISEATH
jgi:hypothetical protein